MDKKDYTELVVDNVNRKRILAHLRPGLKLSPAGRIVRELTTEQEEKEK